MATLSDYMSGTISLANGSVTVTGTGTLFEVTRFREGDTLQIQNLTAVIASVDSDTQLTLTEPWTGASIVNGAYRARQLGDGSRVSTQAATVIELLGNGVLMNLAELGVEEGKVPVGGPTGEYELADLVTDPNGSLGQLAGLELVANKILNTDPSGDLTQSDITAAALVLLKLAGTVVADRLPYFDGANSAALTNFTALARTLLGSSTGSAMYNAMGAALSSGESGYTRLPNGVLLNWLTVAPAADGAFFWPMSFTTTNYVALGSFAMDAFNSTEFIGVSVAKVNAGIVAVRRRYIGNGGLVATTGGTWPITVFGIGV